MTNISINIEDNSSTNTPTELQKKILNIIDVNERNGVTTDVSIIDMQSGHIIIEHNRDVEQFAASVNKVPVGELLLADLRSGKLTFNQELVWPESDRLAGEGYYDQPGAPTHATLQELFFDMLNRSSNTAVNVFVMLVLGGPKVVNDRFKLELHLIHTYLQPLDDGSFWMGNTASGEALDTIQSFLSGNDEYQQFVYGALSTNIFIEFGVKSQQKDFPTTPLANKVGFLNDPTGNNRHDVGILYNVDGSQKYAYALLTTAQGADYNNPTSQGGVSLAQVGRILFKSV